jgi:hypothetical protein
MHPGSFTIPTGVPVGSFAIPTGVPVGSFAMGAEDIDRLFETTAVIFYLY